MLDMLSQKPIVLLQARPFLVVAFAASALNSVHDCCTRDCSASQQGVSVQLHLLLTRVAASCCTLGLHVSPLQQTGYVALPGVCICQVGADGTQSGWFSDDGAALAHVVNPFAIDWRTTDYLPGDVLVLGTTPAPLLVCLQSGSIIMMHC